MDRNSIIGIILIGVILIGYSFYMQPTEAELQAQKAKNIAIQDSIAKVNQQKEVDKTTQLQDTLSKVIDTTTIAETSDTAQNNNLLSKYGIFSNATQGKQEYYVIENDLIKIKISSKGGRIVSAFVKNYDTFDSLPVNLIDEQRSKFNFTFFVQNRNIKTEDLFFVADEKRDINVTGEKKSLSVKAKIDDDKYIEYIYSLKPNTYLLDYSIKFVGLNNDIASNVGDIPLDWQMDIPKQEKSAKNENTYSNIYYKVKGEDVDYLSATSSADEDIRTAVSWIGFKDQFFASVFIAKTQFTDAKLTSKAIWKQDTMHIKTVSANIAIPFKGSSVEQSDFMFYFGPTKFSLLQNYSEKKYTGLSENIRLEKIVPLGWGVFAWVNQYAIIPIFNFLSSFISSYGLIILLLTVFIKLVLFPLTYKSYTSTAKMRVLKPQIDAINEKIPKDKAMERQKATMALYKKVGVNPMGGCLPMLLQFPILIAMFRFFPASIELRHQSFLWATDLSAYDSVFEWTTQIPFLSAFYGNHISLFTILMTISTLLYTKMQNEMNAAQTQMAGMKTMMYFMPIIFMFMLNNYASGLTYYYFLANMITFAQMYLIKKSINDEVVLKKLETAKAKPAKKKSGFQKKLEDMAKQKGYNK